MWFLYLESIAISKRTWTSRNSYKLNYVIQGSENYENKDHFGILFEDSLMTGDTLYKKYKFFLINNVKQFRR